MANTKRMMSKCFSFCQQLLQLVEESLQEIQPSSLHQSNNDQLSFGMVGKPVQLPRDWKMSVWVSNHLHTGFQQLDQSRPVAILSRLQKAWVTLLDIYLFHLALLQETHSFSSQLLGSRTVVLEARSEICLGVSKGSSLSRRSLSKEDCLNIMVDGLQESKVGRVLLEARHGRGPNCLVASWGGGALSLSAPGTYSNWIFESSQPLELWE